MYDVCTAVRANVQQCALVYNHKPSHLVEDKAYGMELVRQPDRTALPQLFIVQMPRDVADILLLQILLKCFRQVHAGLVGETNEDPKHVGQFVAEVFVFVRLFLRLFAIAPGHDAGYFANFFGQHGHVSQFAEVAYANGFDPIIDSGLGVLESHKGS